MDIFFVIVTALVAWHGLTFKDTDGKKDFVRLLFGAIALLFCLSFFSFIDFFHFYPQKSMVVDTHVHT